MVGALKEQEQDEKDSDELMYEDVVTAEEEMKDAERAYGDKYREVENARRVQGSQGQVAREEERS